MTYTYIAIISVINIAITCVNLYTNVRSEQIAERLDAINTRLNVHDKAIRGAYQSIDDGADIYFELHNDLEKLKKNAERTHLISLAACNVLNINDDAWKHARKTIEEETE